jgi:hypothetical protein
MPNLENVMFDQTRFLLPDPAGEMTEDGSDRGLYDSPCPSAITATLLVINFKALSLSCCGFPNPPCPELRLLLSSLISRL